MEDTLNPNVKAIYRVWNDSTSNYAAKKTPLEVIRFEKLVADLFSVGPYYYYVIDFTSFPALNLSYIDSTVEDFYGVSINDFTLDHILQKIHPDDIDYVTACEKSNLIFVTKHKNSRELLNYKFSQTFRIKNKHNEYKYIQHQSVVISLGENGTLGHVINVHSDISHIVQTPPKVMSILGLNGRSSYIGIDPYNPSFDNKKLNPLTPRELEILKLLSRGFESKDIAKSLKISSHTVATHRKNMLRKMDVSNTPELIQKAKQMLLF